MGIVPKELDGAIVTNDFLTYDIDASQLHPKYLDYLTSTDAFVSECRQASEGTTNRVRLKPEIFAEIEIPLPPLDEQQRIAAILDRLMDLKTLQIEIEQELEDLISSLLQKAFAGGL